MRFRNVTLAAVTCELPPRVVTSAQIEERLAPVYDKFRLPYGRLELMTGIRERRFWEPGTKSSAAAARAGRKALNAGGVPVERVGAVIHCSVCRDFLEPATASVVHHELGLPPTAMAFDLSNACLGVLSGVQILAGLIELGQIEAGLAVSGEVAEGLHEATIHSILHDSRLTRRSFKRHFASLTIGSGAAAILVCRADLAPRGHRLLGGALLTDSAASELCREDTSAQTVKADGPLMDTDSEALLHAGCALAQRTWEVCKTELGWENATPDHFFTHQVGVAHRRLLFEMLALDPAKDYPTVEWLGNTGSAALPTALALGGEKKGLRAGEKVALLGIGSGLASLMLGIEW